MKKTFALLSLLMAFFTAHGQCSSVDVSVSSSDTTHIQLYHPGFFNIPSGFANICVWEVTTFSGAIVHQATTSGDWADQSFMLFDHMVPITDSMQVTLVISNDTSNITCTIIDTLYWNETEVLPGSFIGNWAILGSNGGLQTGLNDQAKSNSANIIVFPSPTVDHIQIKGTGSNYALSIVDVNGALMVTHTNVKTSERVDVSRLPTGVYFIRIWNDHNVPMGVRRFVKM